ncbi:MAG: hypothetical protein EOP41_01590 [Sphingobacteriaceae bacterium]|nr:MAG: hypothetical protein EOP41_01590 [Sphingobacteriaceae bacterium]
MNNFFRAIIAGWGAKKLGGGCLSTVVIFIVIYTLLGKCNNQPAHAATRPAYLKTQFKAKSNHNKQPVANFNLSR